MAARNDSYWLFVAEWFDPLPQLKKRYLLKYYVDQNAAEMVDLKSKKLFLKKSVLPPEISSVDFFLGAKVNIFSRELELVDFGDSNTKNVLQHVCQQMVFLFPSETYMYWGKCLDIISSQFTVTKAFTFYADSSLCNAIDHALSSKHHSSFVNGTNLFVHANGENGYQIFDEHLFPQMQSLSSSLNSLLYSSESEQTNRVFDIFSRFEVYNQSTSTLDNCTCCIVMPHAYKSKLYGKILDIIINQGYEVSAIRTATFDRTQAMEFLEVYDGVVPDFGEHVSQLSQGLCMAMEIRSENAVATFRQTCGPWDIDMAKELYPDSIRGRFGINRIQNAVHCTDLPQDGALECEYCFRLLP